MTNYMHSEWIPFSAKTRTLLLSLLLGIGCSGVGGDSSTSPDADVEPIRIGLLVPVTGSWARGLSWNQAAQLAIDEINESGGVLGRPLELLIANTETVRAIAVEGARQLVEDGVVVIIGPGTSSATIDVAQQVTIPAGIPLITPSATSPLISELDDAGLVWRTAASDVFQGRVAAQWAFSNGHQTAGILYVDNAYGSGLSDAFAASFEQLGGTVTASIAYADLSQNEIASHDYSLDVSRVFAGAPQLIYLITYESDGAKITIAASQRLPDHPVTFFACDAIASSSFLENSAPEVTERMLGAIPFPRIDSEAYRHFNDLFRATFDAAPPESYGDATYDAVYLAALALQQAGAVDASLLTANLPSVSVGGTQVVPGKFAEARDLIASGTDIDYEGAGGEVDFDENGDIMSGTYLIWKVENGSLVDVETTSFP
jgi:ABC-type branched-subunit amino acid transport system substrate-binding protein